VQPVISSDVRVGTIKSIPFWMKELLTDVVVISNSPLLSNMRINSLEDSNREEEKNRLK
jgi:hypothetical protein